MRHGFEHLCLAALMCFAPLMAIAGTPDDALVHELNSFAEKTKALEIPAFDYNYRLNFSRMQNLAGVERQIVFYQEARSNLAKLPRSELSQPLRYLYDLLAYEIVFNLERVDLERTYKSIIPAPPIPDGLAQLPNHHAWYLLYAKRWASRSLDTHELIELGASEIRKVKEQIKRIQESLGYGKDDEGFYAHLNSDSFSIGHLTDVIAGYEARQKRVQAHLAGFFSDIDIPNALIKPAPNANTNTPPGYYSGGTFYFNFFSEKHNKRAMDWLFIHEAIPGHHYHVTVAARDRHPAPAFRKIVSYPGHSEGWGAYTEHLGEDLGLYQSAYDWLGKWEWDLVRSTRIVMDVGINDLGWSREEARAYWRRKITNRDDIMEREITRMIDWPGQVLSYKVGEEKILALRKIFTYAKGKNASLKEFHHLLVKHGSLPLPVLETLVLEAL